MGRRNLSNLISFFRLCLSTSADSSYTYDSVNTQHLYQLYPSTFGLQITPPPPTKPILCHLRKEASR